MAVYIIHMFEILLLDYFLPSRVKHQKMYLLIQFLILVLLYTLRSYTVGRDTYQFVTAFDLDLNETPPGCTKIRKQGGMHSEGVGEDVFNFVSR